MKKTIRIIGLVLISLTTLSSCTTESTDETQVQLLKKIVEVSVDGSSNTTLLTYNRNKIVSIDKVDTFSTFYYTKDLITKITELDKSTQRVNTLQYAYTDGKLTKITSSDNYVFNYTHNKDESVSYEKLTKDSNNNDVKIFHGTLYFQNGNIIKDDKTFDGTETGVLVENSTSIEYDYKKNALHNILGFSKLIDYSKTISSNNITSSLKISSVKHLDENQITSSTKMNLCKYLYDLNDYPTEIVSENILFGETNSKHVKSLLFYN
jgi:hypothetical protein